MAVSLTATGIEQVVGGVAYAQIAWADVVRIDATCADHMTQRVTMLSIVDDAGDAMDLSESEAGWDALLSELGVHLPLAVTDLPAVVAMLRSDETRTVFAR